MRVLSRFALVAACTLATTLVGPGHAQAPGTPPAVGVPPPTSGPPPTVSPGAPPATAAPPAGAARQACRTEIDGRRLTGPERQEAMRACMRGPVEACRKEAATQGIPARSGERREFVKACLQKT